MASITELREERLKKRKALEDLGINPYPSTSNQEVTLVEISKKFRKFKRKEVSVVGRVMSLRGQGAILFADLYDGTAKFQAVFKEDAVKSYIDAEVENAFGLISETLDMGDFVEVRGTTFKTQKGQESLEVHSWKMLSKSLLPIPSEHYGIKDQDERYRKRYLDILMNEDARDIFVKKTKFWDVARHFMIDRGFAEVETPTLELTTGGAEATPFKTHHNDFDLDLYLRIAAGELWLKRLMVAQMPKVFEIGRVFRNEGSSTEHVQEFTNLEFYAAFMNLDQGKEIVRDLYITLAKEVFGTTKFETRGHSFDLADRWEEIDYVSTIGEKTGINVLDASEEDMKAKLEELGVEYEGENKERMTDSLWKYCRKSISGPAYLVNHPKLVAPLSKTNSEDPRKTEMFQVIIAGSEIGRAHAELNDPVEQRERFSRQKELIEAGDEEAMMADLDYVEAMEHGMPPTFGFGFGERFFAFLADKSVREIQTFPLVKPK